MKRTLAILLTLAAATTFLAGPADAQDAVLVFESERSTFAGPLTKAFFIYDDRSVSCWFQDTSGFVGRCSGTASPAAFNFLMASLEDDEALLQPDAPLACLTIPDLTAEVTANVWKHPRTSYAGREIEVSNSFRFLEPVFGAGCPSVYQDIADAIQLFLSATFPPGTCDPCSAF